MLKKYKWLFYLISLVTIGVIYFLFDPSDQANQFPSCPSKTLLGISCPGCGSQRALHHLLHLRITEAVSYNPIWIIAMPYVMIGFVFEIPSIRRSYPKLRKFLFGRVAIWVILVTIILYGIFRNVFHF